MGLMRASGGTTCSGGAESAPSVLQVWPRIIVCLAVSASLVVSARGRLQRTAPQQEQKVPSETPLANTSTVARCVRPSMLTKVWQPNTGPCRWGAGSAAGGSITPVGADIPLALPQVLTVPKTGIIAMSVLGPKQAAPSPSATAVPMVTWLSMLVCSKVTGLPGTMPSA